MALGLTTHPDTSARYEILQVLRLAQILFI